MQAYILYPLQGATNITAFTADVCSTLPPGGQSMNTRKSSNVGIELKQKKIVAKTVSFLDIMHKVVSLGHFLKSNILYNAISLITNPITKLLGGEAGAY